MAGPWFTVQKSGGDWETLDTIWISNGVRNDRARVQVRLKLEQLDESKELASR